jgi:Rrf2 family protein
MRMNQGVEWGLHCCVALGWIGQNEVVSTAKLAAKFDLPAAYLNKSLQALARAGVLVSSAGPRGGFRLARAPSKITLLEVVDAIEGPEAAFRCTEIRRTGDGASPASECKRPCAVASAMRQAEMAWRKELSSQTIATVMMNAPQAAAERAVQWFETTRTAASNPATAS